MFNQAQQNSGVVAGNLQQVLLALRSAARDAADVCGWVVSQSLGDLEAIGFSPSDAVTLQSICTDITALLNAASGGAPAPQKDYMSEAMPLIGPNR